MREDWTDTARHKTKIAYAAKSKHTARKGGQRREKSTIESYHSGRHKETSALTQVDYSSTAVGSWFPQSLRRETLEKIHNGHQGIQRCRLRAKISVWWPGISKEIEEMVKQCHWCAQQFTPRKEPMIASELPQFPWQKIGVDLFHLNGATYLVAVDYFSRFPEVTKLTSTTSPAVITVLKSRFSQDLESLR